MENKLSREDSSTIRWFTTMGFASLVHIVLNDSTVFTLSLHGAKLYLMDDGRWLILDYLNIPDAPRHYIDCMEGDICNMNVRIISDETKREIENNQEIFQEEFQ